jgi:hypothetical protein
MDEGAFNAQSAALSEVVRALNIAQPSYGQARAAMGTAATTLHEAYGYAEQLPSGGFASAFGIGVSSASAKRDLDGARKKLEDAYARAGSGGATDLVPDPLWQQCRAATVGAYTSAFVVKATAIDSAEVSFTTELGRLSQNLSEAPAYFAAAAEAVGDVAAGVVDKVAAPAIGSVVGALLPVLLVVGVLLLIVLNSKAGTSAATVAAGRVGR